MEQLSLSTAPDRVSAILQAVEATISATCPAWRANRALLAQLSTAEVDRLAAGARELHGRVSRRNDHAARCRIILKALGRAHGRHELVVEGERLHYEEHARPDCCEQCARGDVMARTPERLRHLRVEAYAAHSTAAWAALEARMEHGPDSTEYARAREKANATHEWLIGCIEEERDE
jgi:hypothetical protein